MVHKLDDGIITAIKIKAKLNGHSLEQELREIIKRAAPLSPRERVVLSRRIRGMQSKPATLDSTDVIRQARDTR